MKPVLKSLLASAATVGFFLMAQGVAAETIAPVALPEGYEGTEPAVTIQNWVLVPSLDAEGKTRLDVDGNPLMEMVETETNEVVPGNTVVYEFTVTNPSDAPLESIQLKSEFPATLALEADSFSGPEGMIVAFSTADAPDTWYQIQPLPPEAEREEMPSIDAIANLRVTVPQVPVQTQALVSYAAVVRQGATTTQTTTQTLESE
jgi:uncharacterized repeat protein (TIGR01451 family)